MVDAANLSGFLSYLNRLDVHLSVEHGRLGCTAPKGVLTEELKEELKARKAEILEFLQERAQCSSEEDISTSISQERLWLLQHAEAGRAAQNLTGGLRFSGALNRLALERALKEIIRRHGVLRTSILDVDGAPQAVLRSEFEWKMDIRSLKGIPESERERELWSIASVETSRPFDLASAPLIRVSLVVLSETDHVLLVSLPQVAADGWSLGIFAREVARIYEAFSKDLPSPLPELSLQYVDYA